MPCTTCFRLKARIHRLQLRFFQVLHSARYQVAAPEVLATVRDLDECRQQLWNHESEHNEQRAAAA